MVPGGGVLKLLKLNTLKASGTFPMHTNFQRLAKGNVPLSGARGRVGRHRVIGVAPAAHHPRRCSDTSQNARTRLPSTWRPGRDAIASRSANEFPEVV